jgi:hypothetical protein
MNEIIDTNILYYKFDGKSRDIAISNRIITSVNALEFLNNIEKINHNRAKYHIPLINSVKDMYRFREFAKSENRPFNKKYSDSIKFDFKQDLESYAFYNNEAISNVINNNDEELFNASISFLGKEKFKILKQKYKFLIENRLTCLPIDIEDIELGYNLLELFLEKYSLKDDTRSCWNDILILAKTINTGSRLITSDSLLNRFASEIYESNLIVEDKESDIISLKFPPKIEFNEETKKARRESKNYINRGWDYKFRKNK